MLEGGGGVGRGGSGRGGGEGKEEEKGGRVHVIIRLSLQWVVSLELDVCTEKLVATCQDAVYIIDTQVSITTLPAHHLPIGYSCSY